VVVEAGCGSSEWLRSLGGQFDQRIGLDISTKRLEKAGIKPDGWTFKLADLNSPFPLADRSVEVVLANQVIEHVIDPFHVAQEIHRVLKPGGRCVLTTPNMRYLKNLGAILFAGKGPRTAHGNMLDGRWDDGHLHYFTHRDLRDLFVQVGFSQAESTALIDTRSRNLVRKLLDMLSDTAIVREFLSGNILFWAVK
jgi:SAM-dependent methyltransferase